jgi:hypothetical protein
VPGCGASTEEELTRALLGGRFVAEDGSIDPLDPWIHFSMEKEGGRACPGTPMVPIVAEKLKYRNEPERKSFK